MVSQVFLHGSRSLPFQICENGMTQDFSHDMPPIIPFYLTQSPDASNVYPSITVDAAIAPFAFR